MVADGSSLDTKLSEHFTLRELTRTSKDLDNTPNSLQLGNLIKLCVEILEPMRAHFGVPLHVNSGFRSQAVNAATKGSAANSAHCFGCAADLAAPKGYSVDDMIRWVVLESGLAYDQVIDEERRNSDGTLSRWLHIGMLRPGYGSMLRRQALIRRDGPNNTEVWSTWRAGLSA